MQVKFKRLHESSKIPSYANAGDAGLDLTASVIYDVDSNQIVYGTGIAVEIPHGYVGLIFPRSSICKKDLALSNSVGVIDSGYRGEIKFVFNRLDGDSSIDYRVGDRIGQLIIIPYPNIELIEVNELSSTNRGEEGFGSTGN